MLTTFTFGYWGWGSTTKQLVQAVDAAEADRGFEPPVFVDIRLQRTVRAPGFSGAAFADVVGKGRYQWMQPLGNNRIATHEGGVEIRDPSAAADLLAIAIELNKTKRRLLFFCACAGIGAYRCHRHTVASLVLKEARKTGRRLQIIEWPGGSPLKELLPVNAAVFQAVQHGRKSVPMDKAAIAGGMTTLPWGSVVNFQANDDTLAVVTGPAMFQHGWCLPVLNYEGSQERPTNLKTWAERFRRDRGSNAKRV
jgi:hypothetical protein